MGQDEREWLQLHPDYARVLARVSSLGPDEERILARRARAGDAAARDRLVEGCLRYVVKAVRRYRRPGVDLMDLVAEGNAGLLRAIGRFDPDRGIRLVGYAAWWIRDAVTRFLAAQAGAVPIPRKAAAGLCARGPGGRAERRRLAAASRPGVPLVEAEAAGGERPRQDRIPVVEDPAGLILEVLERQRRHQALAAALSGLPPREREAVTRYHGLGTEAGLDFRSLARIQGISRETSRCLYLRALRRLREALPPAG